MHLVEKYVNALMTHNSEVVANLFTDDACFEDQTLPTLGGKAVICRGKQEILDYFLELFNKNDIRAELKITFAKTGFFDLRINGTLVNCMGAITEKNGKIQEMIASPR